MNQKHFCSDTGRIAARFEHFGIVFLRFLLRMYRKPGSGAIT